MDPQTAGWKVETLFDQDSCAGSTSWRINELEEHQCSSVTVCCGQWAAIAVRKVRHQAKNKSRVCFGNSNEATWKCVCVWGGGGTTSSVVGCGVEVQSSVTSEVANNWGQMGQKP